jgi:zinc transporter 2
MISIWISQKAPSSKQSFGYHRAEVLGALASVLIIWIMVVWLVYEATIRIVDPNIIEIDAPIMIVTAFVSLACNIFNLIVLGHFPLPCIKGDGSNIMDGVQSIYKPHGGHSCSGHSHGGGGHDHGHSHSHGHEHKHEAAPTHDSEHSHNHEMTDIKN